jgi:rare lipoprotein A
MLQKYHHAIIKSLLILLVFINGFHLKAQEDSTGLASFYHKKFNGRRTSSGEKFYSHKFTCAHRTYPFNSWLEVISLTTQKKTYVRVNDRGPHKKTRLIDLSYNAAKEIGIIATGIAAVKVRLLEERELTDSLLTIFKMKDQKKAKIKR